MVAEVAAPAASCPRSAAGAAVLSCTRRARPCQARGRVGSRYGDACDHLRVSGLRDLEHLSGIDLIRVLDDVLVRFVDLLPLLRVAVELLGDLRETVSLHHRIG